MFPKNSAWIISETVTPVMIKKKKIRLKKTVHIKVNELKY